MRQVRLRYQAFFGQTGNEQQAERILGSVETVVCHRVNTPERIAALAGTRERPEYSMHYDAGTRRPRALVAECPARGPPVGEGGGKPSLLTARRRSSMRYHAIRKQRPALAGRVELRIGRLRGGY